MTREQQVRHECLFQLYGAQRLAVTPEHAHKVAKRNGDDFTPEEMRNGFFFLKEQGFASEITDPATGAQRYRITGAGILHYERENG